MAAAKLRFLDGGGEIGAMMRARDWSETPLGPAADWPQPLKSVLSVLLNSPILGAVLWGPDLLMLYNDACIPALADRHPTALGRPVSEVWGTAWAQVSPPFYHCLKTGESFEHRHIALRIVRNGTPVTTWWDFSAAPIRGEDGDIVGLLNQGIEITVQFLAERKLRQRDASREDQSAARTAERNRIWNVSRDMLLVADGEGVWLDVNPAWTRVLGWSAPELVGRTFEWIEHPDDHEKTRAEIAKLASGATTLEFENRLRTQAGDYRDLAWTAARDDGLLYAAARDVTVDKARAASLRLYHNIVQSDPEPICCFDTEFRLIAFNQAHNDEFFRVNGFMTKIGDVFPDQFIEAQRPVMRALMARALTGETFTDIAEFGRPELGMPHWEITYTPLRDVGGAIIGAFHQARDISARLHAEAELQDAQEALRQSQKMEAVGQLTGGVAHDFNNLLTVIRGSVDLLRRPGISEERRARYVDAIGETADRATKLTAQLLAFARRQSLKPEIFDVGRSVLQIADMVGTLAGSRVRIETRIPDERCYINADPSQFDISVVNMAVNARDAMDGEGTLTIAVHAAGSIPKVRERPAVDGDYIAISVTDTGTGIASDILERIFEPFFTTKAVGKGTGLGLSQVFGFARQSGGEIHVETLAERGTTFTMYLPRSAEPDDTIEPRQPDQRVDGRGLCVLLVEDNADVGNFATQALTELGYLTVWTPDGPSALAILANEEARFDIVFSDVVMPGMSGIELAHEVRRLHPALPIILTSGYSDVLAEQGSHGFDLLHKPYSIEQLSRSLRAGTGDARRRRDRRTP